MLAGTEAETFIDHLVMLGKRVNRLAERIPRVEGLLSARVAAPGPPGD